MEIKGILIPDELMVENQKLHLVGTGIRKLLFVNIYIGAFYSASLKISTKETYTANISRLIRMHLLMTIGTGSFISKILSEGMEKSGWKPIEGSEKIMEEIAVAMESVSAQKNDFFDIVWLETGYMVILKNDIEIYRAHNTLEFVNKIFGIWFDDTKEPHVLRSDLLKGLENKNKEIK
jgi:hypothetical protein